MSDVSAFDIVIPLGPKEIGRIHDVIKHTKKNVVGYRNIYIVSCDPNIVIEDCIIIDENIFGFKDYIQSHFNKYDGKNNRNGWYLQQLIKLYASFYIDGILDNYLIIDSDVFFLKKTFFMEDNKYFFTLSNEYHMPYFKHMKKLHETLGKNYAYSGISHHMMFNKIYLKELFDLVETTHNGIPFWMVFINMVDEHKNHHVNWEDSGASEYEIYFNYMVKYHPDRIIIRRLDFKLTSITSYNNNTYDKNIDFISVCSYML